MIRRNELEAIGRTVKPHGINGEIAATIDSDIDIEALHCIVLEIDGIFVPFFIESMRSRGSEAVLLTIDGIKNEAEAATICGLDVYCLKSDLGDYDEAEADDGFYISDLVGYNLFDDGGEEIGEITGYDDSTVNTLLIVEDKNGNTRYIPVADDLIKDFDQENKTITLILPEGLLEL